MMEYFEIIRCASTPTKAKMLGTQRKHRYEGSWNISKDLKHLGSVNDNIEKYRDLKMREGWNLFLRDDVMREAIFHKFTQNDYLLEFLRLSRPYPIIINHLDGYKYWSISECTEDPSILHGENKLGVLLTELRIMLFGI